MVNEEDIDDFVEEEDFPEDYDSRSFKNEGPEASTTTDTYQKNFEILKNNVDPKEWYRECENL